jgi:glutaredoxin-like protein
LHTGGSQTVGYPVPMPLTSAEREAMAGRLTSLTHPVRLALYTRADGCDTCADTQAIVEEVAGLSPHLSVDTHDQHGGEIAPGVEHVPAIVVLRDVDGTPVDHGVRLIGAPVGHELTSLADAILTVGSGDPGLTAESLARLATLAQPVHVQVFSTPTCVYCPRAVALAHRLAVASPLISATAYSVIEFPDLIRRHRVTGVPKIVVDTGVELLGAQPEAALVDAVLTVR